MAPPDPNSESTTLNLESNLFPPGHITTSTSNDELQLISPPATPTLPPTSTTNTPIPLQNPVGPPPPAWLSSARDALLSKYPTDRFDTILRNIPAPAWRIKCLDCPGKLYNLGPGESLDNFEVHLKNRIHRQNVNSRMIVAGVQGNVGVSMDATGNGA